MPQMVKHGILEDRAGGMRGVRLSKEWEESNEACVTILLGGKERPVLENRQWQDSKSAVHWAGLEIHF